MTDYSALVEKIRATLCSESDPDAATLSELAADYSAALREVNDRLTRCEAVLHAGHRAEALQMCESEPKLLDVVAVLDFTERDQWGDYVRQFGLNSPPELAIDVAGDLNEAYAVAAPLDKLMRLHRRYALARVPLVHRLDLLRKIAAAEKGNPLWEEDVRTFETARHGQIGKEADTAARRNDLQALSSLEEELRAPTWRAKPTAGLVKQVAQAHRQLRRATARQQMQSVAQALTEAYSSLDPRQARALRSQWEELAATAELPADAPEFDLVGPALDWLVEEDRASDTQARFEADVAALERGLDEQVPTLELERLHRAATQHGRDIGNMLEAQYAERLRYLAGRESQRFKLMAAGLAFGVLAILGAAGYAIHTRTQSEAIEATVAAVEARLKGNDPTGAQQFLEDKLKENPWLRDQPQIQELDPRVKKHLADDSDHRQRVKTLLAEARRVGVDEVDRATFPAAFDRATKIIDELRKTARSEEEKARIDDAASSIRAKNKTEQQAVDAGALAELNKLKDRLGTMPDQWSSEHQRLVDECRVLMQTPNLSPQYRTQVDQLSKLLAEKRGRHLVSQEEQSLLAQITQAIPRYDVFAERLEAYRTRFKDVPSTRADEFGRVIEKEIPHWKEIRDWDQFAERWLKIEFGGVDVAQAKDLLKEADAKPKQDGRHAATLDLDVARKYLTAIKDRVDFKGESSVGSLSVILNEFTMNSLYMVKDKEGVRYYGPKAPAVISAGDWSFNYFETSTPPKKANSSEKQVKPKLFKDSEIRNRPVPTAEKYDWVAPQSVFAKRAASKLEKLALGEAGWDDTFGEIIEDLLAPETDIDAIKKILLLNRFIEKAGAGSLALKEVYAPVAAKISQGGLLKEVDWFAPNLDAVAKQREEARTALANLPQRKAHKQIASRIAADVRKSLTHDSHEWIAWLHKTEAGEWICRRNVPPGDSVIGDLQVLNVLADGKESRFETIGKLERGRLIVDGESLKSPGIAVEGRAVFLKKSR